MRAAKVPGPSASLVSSKYNFYLREEGGRYGLPGRITLAQEPAETSTHIVLKLLSFLLFRRERLQIETALNNDDIPFVPNIAQLDYQMRPVLWVECGECSVAKLDKLAVKVPEAEIWVVKRSCPDVEELLRGMQKHELRRQRYQIIGMEPAVVDEIAGLLRPRNELYWLHSDFEPPEMQFDFNGLWFDTTFTVFRF